MEQNMLITPERVVSEAFRPADFVRADSVLPADILAAQSRHLAPVLGELYPQMLRGEHPELLDGYIAAPLALYVRAALLPRLWLQSSDAGVVRIDTQSHASASRPQLKELVRQTLRQARELMLRAVRHIEQNPHLYPGYEQRDNILHRCSICGGVILTGHGTDL